jgi:hypothetical protein
MRNSIEDIALFMYHTPLLGPGQLCCLPDPPPAPLR